MEESLRVLIVEDTQSDAELAMRELRSARISFVAECVETESDFREKLQSFHPNIVLSDYSLPTFNGMQALQIVKTLMPHLPFILVTGSLNEETAVECMKEGADDYIIKEHISRLPFAVKSAIEKASMRQKKIEAEAAVRKSEQQFRDLFDSAPVGYHELDRNGCITNVNQTELEMLGYRRDEMIGMPVWKFVPDSDASRQRVGAKLAGSEKVSRNIIGGYTKNNRTIIPVLIEERLMYDEEGTISGIRTIIQDITERKKLEDQLAQVQKMESLGTLASGIAHDFNNILSIIMAYNHMLSKLICKENHEVFLSSLGGIRKATDRGTALVRQILTFARKSDSVLEPVSVNLTITELAGMLTETFPKTVIFKLDLEKAIPVVMMNHNQLHQSLLNLCVNARDAMMGKGELTIRTRLLLRKDILPSHPDATIEDYIQIAVADTGTGIPESIKARIFEPFFTTKEEGKGTGLGLSVVYGAVLALNGFIDVESQPGQGTTFYLSFPVSKETIQEHHDERLTEQPPGGTETILLVEDEEVLANILKMVLEDAGYSVLAAYDGIEGLQLFKRERETIDAVISDIGLPKLSGSAMLEEIIKLKPSVKVLLASGSENPNLMKDILVRERGAFLQKPYNPDDVLKKLRAILDDGKKIH